MEYITTRVVMVKTEITPSMSSAMGRILLPGWITGCFVTVGVPDGAKEATCLFNAGSTSATWNLMSATVLPVLFKL